MPQYTFIEEVPEGDEITQRIYANGEKWTYGLSIFGRELKEEPQNVQWHEYMRQAPMSSYDDVFTPDTLHGFAIAYTDVLEATSYLQFKAMVLERLRWAVKKVTTLLREKHLVTEEVGYIQKPVKAGFGDVSQIGLIFSVGAERLQAANGAWVVWNGEAWVEEHVPSNTLDNRTAYTGETQRLDPGTIPPGKVEGFEF